MGWSKGTGLGKERDGRTQFVRARKKNNNLGIGASGTAVDDTMQAATSIFNNILQRLGKHHDATGKVKDDVDSESDSDDEIADMTTSTRIKRYTAKHHLYSKFRKAKNTSNYSDKQRQELFGVRPALNPAGNEKKDKTTEETAEELHSQTTTSSTNIRDYFKRKMANGKGASEFSVAGGRGYSEKFQTNYFHAMTDAAQPSGRRGLGFGAADDGQAENRFSGLGYSTLSTARPSEEQSGAAEKNTPASPQEVKKSKKKRKRDSSDSEKSDKKKRKKEKKQKKREAELAIKSQDKKKKKSTGKSDKPVKSVELSETELNVALNSSQTSKKRTKMSRKERKASKKAKKSLTKSTKNEKIKKKKKKENNTESDESSLSEKKRSKKAKKKKKKKENHTETDESSLSE
eukprot:906679_1